MRESGHYGDGGCPGKRICRVNEQDKKFGILDVMASGRKAVLQQHSITHQQSPES